MGEKWPLVTPEPVEFEKQTIEVQDFTPSFSKNLGNMPQINEEKNETCQHVTGWTWKH